MVNQFIGNADTATLSNNALKVNNQYYNSWNAECQYNIWSRILRIQTSTVVGGSYIVNIRSTRGNFVVNKTILINYQHSKVFRISELNGGGYSIITVRGVVDGNGSGYLEILDNQSSYTGNQVYNVTAQMLIGGVDITPITSFESGETIPAGYTVGDTKLLNVGGIEADSLGGYAVGDFARIGVANNFGNVTTMSRVFQARHIEGATEDLSAYDGLYLNYNANKPIYIGYHAANNFSANGANYSGNAATCTTASNAINLNGQPASYYLNFNNFTNTPTDVHYVTFSYPTGTGALNIPVMFDQPATATNYNKMAFCRWQNGDPFGFGVGGYGTAIGWHGADTGAFLASAYNSPNVVVGGINGTTNQYKNWQRKVCLYDADGTSFTSSNSNALGGVSASNFLNIGDTLELVGII